MMSSGSTERVQHPGDRGDGYDGPADDHLELRARQRGRVFGEGARPSDEGIFESEPVLGSIGLVP